MEQTIQKHLDVDGSWITVDVYGEEDGPAIVIVPGVMADAAGWGNVASRLTGWRTVAVVNRRGRQPSGPLTSGYGIDAEIRDIEAVMRTFSDVRTLFGWSYGGLIALHLANVASVPHIVAYEPIMAPFGAESLPDLRRADNTGDVDRLVEVALSQVAGMPDAVIESLRSDTALWASLRDVGSPLYRETQSLNDATVPTEFARQAARIDLIVGEHNRGLAPYGTTFVDVARRVPRAVEHELAGQGHLAHVEAPNELAALVSHLRATVD